MTPRAALLSAEWIELFNDRAERAAEPLPTLRFSLEVSSLWAPSASAVVALSARGHWRMAPSGADAPASLPALRVPLGYFRGAAGRAARDLFGTGRLIRGFRVDRGRPAYFEFLYRYQAQLAGSEVVLPDWPAFTILEREAVSDETVSL